MEVTLQTGPLEKAKQFLNILLDLEKYLITSGIYVLKNAFLLQLHDTIS